VIQLFDNNGSDVELADNDPCGEIAFVSHKKIWPKLIKKKNSQLIL